MIWCTSGEELVAPDMGQSCTPLYYHGLVQFRTSHPRWYRTLGQNCILQIRDCHLLSQYRRSHSANHQTTGQCRTSPDSHSKPRHHPPGQHSTSHFSQVGCYLYTCSRATGLTYSPLESLKKLLTLSITCRVTCSPSASAPPVPFLFLLPLLPPPPPRSSPASPVAKNPCRPPPCDMSASGMASHSQSLLRAVPG